MNIYNTGKIYIIKSHQTEDVYIGSTTKTLDVRFKQHKSSLNGYNNGGKKYITSYEIVKFEDAYIELIEEYPCNNRTELHRREGKTIQITPNCINKRIEGRTGTEYRVDNKEKILEKEKQYRVDNKEKRSEYRKQYAIDNHALMTKQRRCYRDKVVKKLLEKKRQLQQLEKEFEEMLNE